MLVSFYQTAGLSSSYLWCTHVQHHTRLCWWRILLQGQKWLAALSYKVLAAESVSHTCSMEIQPWQGNSAEWFVKTPPPLLHVAVIAGNVFFFLINNLWVIYFGSCSGVWVDRQHFLAWTLKMGKIISASVSSYFLKQAVSHHGYAYINKEIK